MRTLHLTALLLVASTFALSGCPTVDDDDSAVDDDDDAAQDDDDGTDDDDSGTDDDDSGLDDDDLAPDDDDDVQPDDDDVAPDDDDVQPDDDDSGLDDDDLAPDDDDLAPDDDDLAPDDDDLAPDDDDDDDDDSTAVCTVADLQLALEARDTLGNAGTTWTTADPLVLVGIVSNPCAVGLTFTTPVSCLLEPWTLSASMTGMGRGCLPGVTSWTVAAGGQLLDAEPVGTLSADTWTFQAAVPGGPAASLTFLVQ